MPLFWVSADEWHTLPASATSFASERAARQHVDDCRRHGRAGFGPQSIVDVVIFDRAASDYRERTAAQSPDLFAEADRP